MCSLKWKFYREHSSYEDVFLGSAHIGGSYTDVFLAFFVIVLTLELAKLREQCDMSVFGGWGQY